jgi:hypothetical protein
MVCKFFNFPAVYGGYGSTSTPCICLHPGSAKGQCPFHFTGDCPRAGDDCTPVA